MNIIGWGVDYRKKTHYFKRKGSRFWNHNAGYLPDPLNPGYGRSEGFFFKYEALCGKDSFVLPVGENPQLVPKLASKKTPCLICLFRLAKARGLL